MGREIHSVGLALHRQRSASVDTEHILGMILYPESNAATFESLCSSLSLCGNVLQLISRIALITLIRVEGVFTIT